MLLERSVFLQRGLFLADLVLTALAWVLAWGVRFEVLTPPEWVPLESYLGFLPVVLVIWGGAFLVSGLYQTRRAQRLPLMVYAVGRAVLLSLGASLAALFFFRTFAFSRAHMLLFGAFSSLLLVGLRLTIYVSLRSARQRGQRVQTRISPRARRVA